VPTRRSAFFAPVLIPVLLCGGRAADAQSLPARLHLVTVEDSEDAAVGTAVLQDAYRRLGIEVEVDALPADVALRRSSSGEVDGEAQRIDGLVDRFPTLVQVPVPINFVEIAVFSKDESFEPRGWHDLERLEVGTLRGIQSVRQGTLSLSSTRLVDTYEELIALLVDDAVDVIVAPVLNTTAQLRRAGVGEEVVMNAVLDSYLLYHYLHESRAALVPVVQPILKQMLLDGTVATMRRMLIEELMASLPSGR
jgi:hypothetical protein